MPWSYCPKGNHELREPVIEDFEYGNVPRCRKCEEPVEYDGEVE